MVAIACAFRWGVALLGEIFYSPLLTSSWDPFQVKGVYRETALRGGRDYEAGRCVALILPLYKVFCIKE